MKIYVTSDTHLNHAKLIEEEVIGKDLRVGDEIAENKSYAGERLHNAIKAEQRKLIKGE